MPLVRIDLVEGRDPAAVRRLADVVQEVLEEVFAAPPRDRYQVINEHPSGHLVAAGHRARLRAHRRRVLVQVFQQGRSAGAEAGLYARLAQRLEADCGVAPTDLVVSVAANGREDWSFGLGRAQFLEGDL